MWIRLLLGSQQSLAYKVEDFSLNTGDHAHTNLAIPHWGNPNAKFQTLDKWLRWLLDLWKQTWSSGSPRIPQSLHVTVYSSKGLQSMVPSTLKSSVQGLDCHYHGDYPLYNLDILVTDPSFVPFTCWQLHRVPSIPSPFLSFFPHLALISQAMSTVDSARCFSLYPCSSFYLK